MHNIVTNFDQIIDFARAEQAPVEKKRGIIREYLQSKFITELYNLPLAPKLSFVGGTSLRLLRNLNRFSEDLDFDNLGLSKAEIGDLVKEVVRKLSVEGLSIELKSLERDEKTYFELKFPHLLADLKISSNPKEKLMVKIDYSSFWKDQEIELVLFNKYGFIGNVVVNKLNQNLVQKLTAYVKRKTTQPRDIYDIVWLYSQKAVVDGDFAITNGVENIVGEALNKYKSEGISAGFKNKLQPFLFDPEDVKKVDLFGSVLERL
jgi:predicted nucleotidyltransferase component of viral defense system